ncbi:restriction endonuclease subunit S [Ruminococcus sp.]|uniref:restriction endonuclease subunit S n=1 Tax=Ruminococcus sp. TaxID=41978 RepID=UPI002E76041F|nr:restriction endonuclease subunit S [Ruminococcus sp.]MEE1264018.1 restriction endonuclease subunit S [Ruminococcus sp.]
MKYNIWKDCRRVPLPELLDFIVDNRGKTVPTVNQNEACNVVLIATNCIRNENLYPVYEKIRFISEDTYKTWFRSHPIPGDIIFVNKGTPGRVCLCPDIIDFCIAQDMMAFRVDSNKLYNEYLLAVLRSRVMQEQIRITSVGDTIPHFKKEFLKDLYIPVPPMEIQRIIGDYYYNLSQKIELNKKINENLEQQAQAVFKSWFVDFEPFGGVMPDDWYVSTLGKVSDMSAGGDKPNNATQTVTAENTIPIYSNGIASEGLYGFTDIAKIQDESVTVSARGTIGYVCLRQTPYFPIVRLVTLVPKKNLISAKYLYHWLKLLHIVGTGTTQQQLTVPSFKKTEIIIPAYSIMERFTKTVNPLYECVLANKSENQHLDSLRDTLLPKLMSGEIDVSEVQV